MQKEDFLQQLLEQRKAQHAFRTLKLPEDKVDFCSNDYLGLARSAAMQEAVHRLLQERPYMHGSTGSRLLAGNYAWIEEVERDLAVFHEAPAGLIYNSGYDANLGLFSCVPQKGDTVIYDQLIHASIRDGIRLSKAQAFSFLHNDVDDLKKKIQHVTGNIFVAVESVYSMDGDMAPLQAIAALCGQTGAHLIVDEAHATAVIGPKGQGLVQLLGLAESCFARVYTYGKGAGCHGALIVGTAVLRDFLINFSRSFIYTTALPPTSLAAIVASYSLFPYMEEARAQLTALVKHFRSGVSRLLLLPSETPIQVLLTPGNEITRAAAAKLQQSGLDVRPILHPTVPRGQERLRIVMHSFNTIEEVDQLVAVLLE
ncbi:aminotransferase class I/II-fold pyridoxal phosphate-dependent enzyme [Chitinophaga defluvii]|uniref:Pyridoxal phosphate-dependent aminotransferase family protein n=1 Tax=Chitinophaga defluvii TaxID=3163343 RepID=A0ABV2T038_9BACT